MKKYQSHKVVKAAKINDIRMVAGGAILTLAGFGERSVGQEWVMRNSNPERPLVGGYLVEYEPDGYLSWSPAEAFEAGYAELTHDPKDGALPVAGYQPQTDAKVTLVNQFKHDEERILRALDDLKLSAEVDQRWLQIGRTALEQAFMAINRSVFQPARVKLPEDDVGA